MKKFLLIAFTIATGFAASAQQAVTPSKATMTATDTGYIAIKVPGFMDVVTLQLNQTKTSGTMAGYATLEGSLDGVNYAVISKDTTVFANKAVNVASWSITPSSYSFYRIASYSTGTNVSAPTGFYLARKRN